MAQRRRTTLEIDDEQLAAAQVALGTHGLKDTVDRALDEAIRAHRRRALIEIIRSPDGPDRDPALLDEVRRWRTD